jgi:hypothetical protein
MKMNSAHQIFRAKLPTVIGTAAVTLALFGGVSAATAATHASIKACASKKTGVLRLAKTCHHNEKPVTWAAQGPRGTKGARGPAGPTTDVSPPNLTQRGVFNMQGYVQGGSELTSDISYPLELSAAPIVDEITGLSDAHCAGIATSPAAAPGYLCIYVLSSMNTTPLGDQGPIFVQRPSGLQEGSATFGAFLTVGAALTGETDMIGTWAVTAP